MKAISLHQPWASYIADGKKTIETRMWSTRYRGDLLIVSTKSPKVAGYPLGMALCIVRVVDCRPMTKADEPAAMCTCDPGRWAWLLEEVRPVEPFAVRGSQGFYEVYMPSYDTIIKKIQGRFNPNQKKTLFS